MLNVDIATGGLFDTPTEVQYSTPPGSDGTITLSFANCNSRLVEYDFPSIERTGNMPIESVAGDKFALCEALSGE